MDHIEPINYLGTYLNWTNKFISTYPVGSTNVEMLQPVNEQDPVNIMIDNTVYTLIVNENNNALCIINPPLLVGVDQTTQIKLYSPVKGNLPDHLISKRQIDSQFKSFKSSQNPAMRNETIDFVNSNSGSVNIDSLFDTIVNTELLTYEFYEVNSSSVSPINVNSTFDTISKLLTWTTLGPNITLRINFILHTEKIFV